MKCQNNHNNAEDQQNNAGNGKMNPLPALLRLVGLASENFTHRINRPRKNRKNPEWIHNSRQLKRIQPALKFIRRQPVGGIPVIEAVSHFAVVNIIMRIAQLEGVGNEFGLLLFIQQGHGAFDLLQTHGHILFHLTSCATVFIVVAN